MLNRSLIRSAALPPLALSFVSVLLLIIPAGGCPDASYAQGCGDIQVNVSPAVPTVDDVVLVAISGMWGSSCTPVYQSHVITSTSITVIAVANPECLPCPLVITPWGFTMELGGLTSGTYMIRLYIAVCSDLPVLCATERLTVFDDPRRAYLPIALSYEKVE